MLTAAVDSSHPARWWHPLPDGRLQCDLCPRDCQLHAGQRGACFVRQNVDDTMVLTTYGRSSGFCIDPIEKKPLNHFYPGSSVLSFGTAGCNLTCRFCQNWDISKAKDMDRLMDRASPQAIAAAARRHGADSVAYTYNDPVIFAEYAIDTALACRDAGIHNVAVTAGYIHPAPAREFFAVMDAANVDLKAFSDDFYHRLCGGRLQPVLDLLVYLHHDTYSWLEITTLLIPGENDSDAEVQALSSWIARELGTEVPLHFTAFHPDWRLRDRPATPPETLQRARRIARDAGLQHVYTGNVHDPDGGTTYCQTCGTPLIVRDWYDIRHYGLTADGACPDCATPLAGRFTAQFGRNGQAFGPRRLPVTVAPI
ncbi:AmmeMemoRadiSam system radical SAM enzyme [Dechloromonas sp.]|uniref:AmmeMemoRadiSam system radical SAM enzyme n=1 Tax=Dechloromonas sp. TaxID=1917218 RepID=UPI001213A1B1|nr:AmmeMemoRadiSam system radical SAM enzyme [Dechloromonas sp.]MBU3697344.1 AmmeMemoRadiSam system radical SAM enzyme [Dechloromonas sp.]TEX49070.1 MAG: AmmeMemoRadiSam system radical SAM enzyme [Rhodocyclaceae bacterium]